MKKNMNKPSVGHKSNYRRGFDLPEVIDMDSLSYYDDDSLERRHGFLQNEREKVVGEGLDANPWEVEICYVQREIKIRSTRRALHEKYIRSNPEFQYYDADQSESDYDHSTN
jgi:hypothetical protein